MVNVKVFGSFTKKGNHTYRKTAYIQWGESEKTLGACLLLNPGSAKLDQDLLTTLEMKGAAKGFIKNVDPTMRQLITIVESIYSKGDINGRLYIYNLFNLQHTRAIDAIELFESQVQSGEYDIKGSLISKSELQKHPWLLLGWGLKPKNKWTNLQVIRDDWIKLINESGIPIFGKKHESSKNYYHVCPQKQSDRQIIVNQIVENYNSIRAEKLKKGSRYLIEKYVNKHEDCLNKSIFMSSPSLLSFSDKSQDIQWKSPLLENGYREYSNEIFDLDKSWESNKSKIEMYWPKKGPQWDGVATVQGKNGEKGLILVEAKAHLHEMRSTIKAKDNRSIELIHRTIGNVKEAVGSQAVLDTWLNRYYQLSNRLAYLYILNIKFNIPTWLILVNFVDDRSYKSTSVCEWLDHYQNVFTEMDINFSSSSLFTHLVNIYPISPD
ncbi:hypothetical protein ABFG93_16085 [Pseudalkalibacillus hwajinpoensis]|uniref:hypothetical protein n=1 Tax=Guptibacillus hwajinpoensis TaxID=208199 RepID=UPI00325BBE4A